MQTFVEYFSGHPTVPFQVDGVGRNLFPRILRLLHCLALHSLAPNSKFEFNKIVVEDVSFTFFGAVFSAASHIVFGPRVNGCQMSSKKLKKHTFQNGL